MNRSRGRCHGRCWLRAVPGDRDGREQQATGRGDPAICGHRCFAAGQRRASEPVCAMELRASTTSWAIRGGIITD